MSVIKTTALALCLALTAGTALAQDSTTKTPATPAGAEAAKPAVTPQECRELASAKKAGMAKDEATMKKEAACSDLLRKDEMKPGAAGTEPGKK